MINIITGFGDVSGSILSHHMDVRALSFTGSGRTGRLIQAASAKSNLKQVFLELGGKSPAVIFEDADIEQAVKETAYRLAPIFVPYRLWFSRLSVAFKLR